MDSIRILLVAMPQLMSDIIQSGLKSQPDIEIVGVLDAAALLSVVTQARPDLLVLGVDGPELPEECGPAFAECPEMRVIGVEQDAAEAALYELRPHRVPLGAVSPADLAAAIRSAARTPVRLWEMR